jgi:hypothetical protein
MVGTHLGRLIWWLAPVLALSIAVVVGVTLGFEVALLVVAGTSLVVVIVFLWSSVQSLTGENPMTLDEALTLAQPSAEQEQKRAVFRALKDLEYERSVGKISEGDFHELSARYRAEAKGLIARMDETLAAQRAAVETKLRRRLERAESTSHSGPKPNRRRRPRDAAPSQERALDAELEASGEVGANVCPSCGTRNDTDARFCKACGEAVGGESA